MSDKPLEKLDSVHDADMFIEFLQTLLDDLPSKDAIAKESSSDLYLNGIVGWMNQDLWSFIEASIAAGQDNKIGAGADSPAQAWKAAATIIYCGKTYE